MKRLNKREIIFLHLLLVLLGAAIISFIIIEGLIFIEGSKTPAAAADYVIVLGARLYADVPSPALMTRLEAAADYLAEHKNVKVIVTGGQGADEKIPEARAMARYLQEKGIEAGRIIIEDKSTSTFENLKYSLAKIKEIDQKEKPDVLIVTNRHHIFRAKFLARRTGMNPEGLPTAIPPTIKIQSYIREYFAVIKSFIFDR